MDPITPPGRRVLGLGFPGCGQVHQHHDQSYDWASEENQRELVQRGLSVLFDRLAATIAGERDLQ